MTIRDSNFAKMQGNRESATECFDVSIILSFSFSLGPKCSFPKIQVLGDFVVSFPSNLILTYLY